MAHSSEVPPALLTYIRTVRFRAASITARRARVRLKGPCRIRSSSRGVASTVELPARPRGRLPLARILARGPTTSRRTRGPFARATGRFRTKRSW